MSRKCLGEGYCVFNDIAVAAACALRDYPAIRRVLLVDLDVHQVCSAAADCNGSHRPPLRESSHSGGGTLAQRTEATDLAPKRQTWHAPNERVHSLPRGSTQRGSRPAPACRARAPVEAPARTTCVFGPPREAPRRGQQRLCPTHAQTHTHMARARGPRPVCTPPALVCSHHSTRPEKAGKSRQGKQEPTSSGPFSLVLTRGVHLQGNGSARIFAADGRVKTYSQHCEGRDSRERAER